MTVAESTLSFHCGGDWMLGILSTPIATARLGVVIPVGGPQYRAGSHRQFVLLARACANAGVAVLRFDYRGMGDSEGRPRSFEDVSDDIAAAIDALEAAVPSIARVVLWGLCDAASAALIYSSQRNDSRIVGFALLNPWVRSEQSQAITQVKHYYRQRLLEREFWSKLLRGQVRTNAVSGLLGSIRTVLNGRRIAASGQESSYQDRMARGWSRSLGPVLLMLSQRDFTAREFSEFIAASPVWRSVLVRKPAATVQIVDADHTCSQPEAQQAIESATVAWLREVIGVG